MSGNEGISRPQPTAVSRLCQYLRACPVVSAVEKLDLTLLIVRRESKGDLKVFLTDTYILGEADVYEVFSKHSDLNAIINMSVWNHYSGEARALCRARGVGLFTFKEFLGAVYYSGARFLDYEPPTEEERRRRRDSNV